MYDIVINKQSSRESMYNIVIINDIFNIITIIINIHMYPCAWVLGVCPGFI